MEYFSDLCEWVKNSFIEDDISVVVDKILSNLCGKARKIFHRRGGKTQGERQELGFFHGMVKTCPQKKKHDSV